MNMRRLPFLTSALLIFFPFSLALAPHGYLKTHIARNIEKKGRDIRRMVRRLDLSQINIEENDPFMINKNDVLHRSTSPQQKIWAKKIEEAGTHILDKKFPKKLSTTYQWSRQNDLHYKLNVSQSTKMNVPENSLLHVESLKKDFWVFEEPLPWKEAKQACINYGLKLAQPYNGKEIEALQKQLHKRIHNKESGCLDRSWTKVDGYCFRFNKIYQKREDAVKFCDTQESSLPYPALGNVTAWKKAVTDYMNSLNKKSRSLRIHAGAKRAPNGEWTWTQDNNTVDESIWAAGNGEEAEDDCSILDSEDRGIRKLYDKSCISTFPTLCQGVTSNHWLGAIGSYEEKCMTWDEGICIENQENDPNSNITELWRAGQPGDMISSHYALVFQVEHEQPFTLMKTTEQKPFLCEPACPLGFVNLGPQCLLVKKIWLPWREASEECLKMGLQLYETEDESILADFLHKIKAIGAYWIGGSERRHIISKGRSTIDMTMITTLPFICELHKGTRKMNANNQLSYEDQENVILPVITTSNNCRVTVLETIIEETYPFSVQMNITGWIWVHYSSPSDEKGGFSCDNNNDAVGGEPCWAHSKWGYTTSSIHNGDNILAHGDNARILMNGTVKFQYNTYKVSTCDSKRKRNSGKGRSRRSVSSENGKLKNHQAKPKDIDDDDSKPVMSKLGNRAGEWVQALAEEKNALLVVYTLDDLSSTVSNFKLENNHLNFMSPTSIFEEEFENTGSERVITTFAKQKSIVNTLRWTVSKGLSIEDSHISSYSMTNSQSKSNTFSLSNNLALTEGSDQSISEDNTKSQIYSEGGSETESSSNINSETNNISQDTNRGETISTGTTRGNSVGNTDSSTMNSVNGSSIGGSTTVGETETISRGASESSGSAQDTSSSSIQTDSETNSITNTHSISTEETKSISQSKTSSKSDTQSNTDESKTSKGSSFEKGGEAGYEGFGVSVKASLSHTSTNNEESSRTSEVSSTNRNEDTSSNEQSTQSGQSSSHDKSKAKETTQSNEESRSVGITNNKETSVGEDETQSNESSEHHERTQTNENSLITEVTSTADVSNSVENIITTDNNIARDKGSSVEISKNKENSINYERRSEQEKRYGIVNNNNRERQKTYETSRGGDDSSDLQNSEERQESQTKVVQLDKSEDVENVEEETLETANEVIIPPNTRVKIEWKVVTKTVQMPWKAYIHLTGWINVRLLNDDQVCDTYNAITGWNYNYTSPCRKDNRLYGYPLSYLKDKHFIQQGDGLRFAANGIFQKIGVTSHFLRVTETEMNTDNFGARRRKRDLRNESSKVSDYILQFDEQGNGRANIGTDNRYFKTFQAKKKYNIYN